MSKHNQPETTLPAYTMEAVSQVLPIDGKTQAPFKEPASNIFYVNYYHPDLTKKLGELTLSKGHVDQKQHVMKLCGSAQETLIGFQQKIIVGTYKPPKATSNNPHSHFINFNLKAKSGHLTELNGYCRFDEDNELHIPFIQRLLDDPESATDILRECSVTFKSAVPIVHEYEDY